jgi:hypothetical protein
MNFCGISLDATQMAALGSFAFAIASELIGRSKLKENSVVDIALNIWGSRVKSITPAHTPTAKEVTPAPKRRGRPPSKKS